MRIFDTFMFDGELALLQHRLTESYDLVDYFVLVEARRTYSDRPKPLVFAAHRAEFHWAASKLRVVTLDSLGGPGLSSRKRASLQRNAVLLALRDALASDVVLLLDADEIPSRELLLRLRAGSVTLPCRLAMTRHHEFMDVLAPASPCCPSVDAKLSLTPIRGPRPGKWSELGTTWFGHSGVAVNYSEISGDPEHSIDGRSAFYLRFGPYIHNISEAAGRHLCAVDPGAGLARKLPRAFHTEHATERAMCAAHLARCHRWGVHQRGWWYCEAPDGPLPDDLARLAAKHPGLTRSPSFQPMLLRRLVCTWSWLRMWNRLPDGMVNQIDRRFPVWMLVLGVPLLMLAMLRTLKSWVAARYRKLAIATNFRAAG
jgi:Glycosyltransferase family 17